MKALSGVVALIMLSSCTRLPDSWKEHICAEASRGAHATCMDIELDSDCEEEESVSPSDNDCDRVAASAYRLCIESMPEEYADD